MTTQTGAEQRLQHLDSTVRALLDETRGLSADALYAEQDGEWSVMKVLAHTAELLPYWARQAEEVAARPQNDQPFGRTHEDPDRIGAVEGHARDRLEDAVASLERGLDEALRRLRGIPAEGWSRTAHHARRGEMTVEQIVDAFLVEHMDEHLAQARRAVGRA